MSTEWVVGVIFAAGILYANVAWLKSQQKKLQTDRDKLMEKHEEDRSAMLSEMRKTSDKVIEHISGEHEVVQGLKEDLNEIKAKLGNGGPGVFLRKEEAMRMYDESLRDRTLLREENLAMRKRLDEVQNIQQKHEWRLDRLQGVPQERSG